MDEEQVARNEALFREANEQIEAAVRRQRLHDRVPFICECADPACRDVVRVTLECYESVRAEPTRFLLTPGHERGPARDVAVVERAEGHVVVEKTGRTGDVAAELDPRSG